MLFDLRLLDILSTLEDTLEPRKVSAPVKSRLRAMVTCAFLGREEALPYDTSGAGRAQKTRDLRLLRAIAELEPELKSVMYKA